MNSNWKAEANLPASVISPVKQAKKEVVDSWWLWMAPSPNQMHFWQNCFSQIQVIGLSKGQWVMQEVIGLSKGMW